MTISQRAVRARRAPGVAGGLYDISPLNDETYFVNAFPQAKQESTIAVSTATDNADYVLSVNGVELTYTAKGSGDTTTTIAAAIAEAANEHPMIRGQVVASSAAAVITLESALPGLEFEVSHADAKLGAVTLVQAAASADAIGFGRLCIRSGSNTKAYDNRQGRVASSSGLTAASVTLKITATASVSLQVGGELVSATGAIAALEAALDGAAGLTASVSSDELTLTAPVGADLKITSLASATVENETAGDDLNELAIGISRRTYDEESTYKEGLVGYPANAGVAALRRGRIWIECTEDAAEGGTVYAGLVGDEAGKLFASAGSGRVALSRDRCRFFLSRAADGLAVVDCNFF